MEIKVKDLEVGDIVIMATNSHLKMLKILELPRLSKTRVSWYTKLPLYINTKCLCDLTIVKTQYPSWDGKTTYERVEKVFGLDENWTTEIKQNLNNSPLWLIRR